MYSPPRRGGGEAPGEGRKTFRILRPSPSPRGPQRERVIYSFANSFTPSAEEGNNNSSLYDRICWNASTISLPVVNHTRSCCLKYAMAFFRYGVRQGSPIRNGCNGMPITRAVFWLSA